MIVRLKVKGCRTIEPSPSMRRPVSVKSVFVFLTRSFWFEPGRLCRHPSIRTLLLSDGSLGASWASSVQQVLLPDNRPRLPSACTGVGPGLGRSHLNSAVELGCSDPTSTPRRLPLCGCSAGAHRLPRSPTACEAVRPTSGLRQRPLAFWHSFLRVRLALSPQRRRSLSCPKGPRM